MLDFKSSKSNDKQLYREQVLLSLERLNILVIDENDEFFFERVFQTLLLLIEYEINHQTLHTQLSWLSTFKNFQEQKEWFFNVFNYIKTTINRYRYKFHNRFFQTSRSKRHLHYYKSTHQETSLRIIRNWEKKIVETYVQNLIQWIFRTHELLLFIIFDWNF